MSIAIPLALIVTSVASLMPPKKARRKASDPSKKEPVASGKKATPQSHKAAKKRKGAKRHRGARRESAASTTVAPDQIRVSADGKFARFGHAWWPTHGAKLVEHAIEALKEREIEVNTNVVTGVVLQLAVPGFAWDREDLRTDAVRRMMQTVHLLVSASMPRTERGVGRSMGDPIIRRQQRTEDTSVVHEDDDEGDEGDEDDVVESEAEVISDGDEYEENDSEDEGEDEVEDEDDPELADVLPHPSWSERVAETEAVFRASSEPAQANEDPAHGEDEMESEPEEIPASSRRGKTRRGSRGGR